MLQFDSRAGLPDKEQVRKGVLSKIAKDNPFPADQCEWLFTPPHIQKRFQEYWRKLAYESSENWDFKVRLQKQTDGFEIREYIHEGLPGWVEAFVRWAGEQVIFGFYLIPYASVDEDVEPGTEDFYKNGCECLGIEGKEKLAKEKQFLEDVWTKAPRAQPFKGGCEPRPNDPCPCGSGKKFKRCCRNRRWL